MASRFKKNKQLLKRALKVTPVGAQTYTKSYRYFPGEFAPYFLDHGKGGHVWDVDGNEYVDFLCGLGAVTVGYADDEINEAIRKQLEKGISFSIATGMEVQLAEKLVEIIPAAEMVRFVKNGGDATFGCVRLARAFTGREMIARCGYHGMHDWYIGSTVNNRGVPEAVKGLTVEFTYNKIDSLKILFEKYPTQIAGVILEPIQENGPEDGFLEQVIALSHKHGAVVIFDEVLSGFRVALGGAQEYYSVTPDLAAIGKGMGNGLAISAVVGKKEILQLIEEGVFISTTFGGETASMAGALKTIEILERKNSYKHLWSISTKMKEHAEKSAKKLELGSVLSMWGVAPHCGFMFEDSESLTHLDLMSVFQSTLLEHGILSIGINNVCLAHTEVDVKQYCEANDAALENVRKALDQGSLKGLFKGSKMNPIFKRN